jgi:hippurate hydrolase
MRLDWTPDAEDFAGRLSALRRAIHAEPELGLHTPRTRDKVRAALAHLPLEWLEGPSTTGMVGILRGSSPGRSVLLRGDMDALPMAEETELEFASRVPGAMHACGHDAHVAMLAGAVELLWAKRESLVGEVRFMFQPGEEGWHGARFMLDDGLLGGACGRGALPDAAFALHVMPNAPHGLVSGRAGPLLAGADRLRVTVKGRGGHASMPHQTLDPVPVACEIVTALQALVTRRFDAAEAVVVTIASIAAGTTHNVIADRAVLDGTMRTLSPGARVRLGESVTRLARGIAAAHGLEADVRIEPGFPITICDARAVDLGEAVARALFGPAAFQRLAAPIMGAEDFAYVLEQVPGAMFFLGVAGESEDPASCCGLHSARMIVDEAALPRGAALLAGLAERFLDTGFAP